VNSLTHKWNLDGSLSRKPPKEGKRKKSRKRKQPRVGKLGIVRLDAAGMKALREERYELDKGCCVDCGVVRPLEGSVFSRMHLAHVVSRGAGGGDTISNTRSKCHRCHSNEHNAGGKPCPKKPVTTRVG
jgi:5-methylcytosine-specific restriction endonuclease McrA